jgi:hypothetical protein
MRFLFQMGVLLVGFVLVTILTGANSYAIGNQMKRTDQTYCLTTCQGRAGKGGHENSPSRGRESNPELNSCERVTKCFNRGPIVRPT